ncbi:MAG: ATP synthase F1 subunit delta [Jaaginema sp. PMC 1079.18]|nr:ATP synthase F1 subunit delta [Jaaginema sp. PMC 1080.18]MEC4851299.1 ATP synthase F1 subunit delta [Jaaginema sp. PMC 1079.18]MEC4867121.1 ATP synthase F1 subunit delta [Jaaginema sp. PMC 1078.18]
MKGSLFSSAIAEPYAQALMSIAQSKDLTNRFGEIFRSLEALMDESAELREFILNPVIEAGNKKAILRRILGDDTPVELTNFVMLLVDKRRIMFLGDIAQQYLERLRKLNNTVLAEVRAAKELSADQEQAIRDRVKAMTNAQEVELKTEVDPSLLGGVIIKVGSQVVDASLRGQLRRIGMRLGQSA